MTYRGSRLSDKLFLYYIRKIPDHPCKVRIIYWINTAFFNDSVKVKSKNGSVYALSTKEYIGHEIIFSDNFEQLTLIKCDELLSNGGNVIDIGANQGLHSIYLSKHSNVRVYAVEPSAHNFQKLLINRALNNAKNIYPLNIGLADKDSFGYLVNEAPGNSGTVMVVNETDDKDAYLIRLCTLADIVNELKLSDIELIKIDVEGFEMNVFKGFFSNSEIMPKNIIMEFGSQIERTGHTMAECYDYLKNLGYRGYTVVGDIYELNDPLPECNLWLKKA
ncbi:MAG: methyltransferase, FkbM family [Mucilaginibacter sp.]|nr:methyltransferase, FkbM family [Mucilaginibacter sp.]